MRYAHARYVKSLFTNIKEQYKMFEINLLFKKNYELYAKITQEFLGLRMRSVQGILFLYEQ